MTREDILEEIVGEIWDEQDEEVESVRKVSTDEYKVLSTLSIDEFFDFFDLPEDEEIESTTVNGWILEQCGVIPEKDYTFDYMNLTVTVIEADELKTQEILIKVNPKSDEDEDKEED